MCCAVSVDARLDVNVALNRPSYQSSTRADAVGTYIAAYANDGNSDSDFTSLSCMHTNADTNPWWAVDLRARLCVHSVKFTNRQAQRTYAVFHVS